MRGETALGTMRAIDTGDVVAIHHALERQDREAEEEAMQGEVCFDGMDDLPVPVRRRQARIGQLERQVQVLRGRIDARDETIRRQAARIEQLQKMLASAGRLCSWRGLQRRDARG